MNRILFDSSEISGGIATFGGERALHVTGVLHGEVGQVLKTGEIDGPVGSGTITEIAGSAEAPVVRVAVRHDRESMRPWADVILAPPRPRVMKRLLPQLAALGAGRIILVGAEKVERAFWGATLLKPETYRPLLIDGLMQCGASVLPAIETWKSFGRFVREGLPGLAAENRIVAHPYGDGERRIAPGGHVVLAIGPEGGWTDPEVERFEENGFRRYSLGPRILRTDTAVVAALAQLMPR